MGRRRTRHPSQQNNATPPSAQAVAGSPKTWPGALWPFSESPRSVILAAGLVVFAGLLAYQNSFWGPFVFDDQPSIVNNATIRNLASLGKVLSPPDQGETVTARPVLNLSFAINYAVGGVGVRNYHVTNLAIHLFNALLLFGILRRTLLLPCMRENWGRVSLPLALVVALAWVVHPLQTESVTYIVQRAESLMGLFYLLTFYCAIRGAESENAAGKGLGWYTGSVLACLLGMASKEVTVSVPLIVLFYDRAFLSGSFREAWRRRYGLYLALASTWILLAWLVLSAGNRAGSVGVNERLSAWNYLCTQCVAIVHYLRLSVWPHPLIFDYGTYIVRDVVKIVLCALVVVSLGLATTVALWRWPKASLLGLWFFAILAPTSSVLPVCASQTISEHRMYLPLAAVLTGLVFGGYLVGRALMRRRRVSLRASLLAGGFVAALAIIALGIVTYRRNAAFSSEIAIWQDTADSMPGNARAHNNLGVALAKQKRLDDAIGHYEKALELNANYTEAHCNYGNALARQGKFADALTQYQKALAIDPEDADAHCGIGNTLAEQGQFAEAIGHYERSLRVKPQRAETYCNYGNALVGQLKFDDAVAQYRKALECDPDYAEAHYNYGNALARQSQFDDAIVHYRQALTLKPDYADARNNLIAALVGCGRVDEAIACFRTSAGGKTDQAEAYYGIGNVLAGQAKFDDAILYYRKALELKADHWDALNNLAAALTDSGRVDDAIAHCRQVLKLRPQFARARNNLQIALTQQQQIQATLARQRELVRSRPDDAKLQSDLAWMLATNPNASVRNAAEAVALAQRAVELSGGNGPTMVDALAAAYAEAGRFPEAVQTAQKAGELAAQQNQAALQTAIAARRKLYEAGQPYRETPPPGSGSALPSK